MRDFSVNGSQAISAFAGTNYKYDFMNQKMHINELKKIVRDYMIDCSVLYNQLVYHQSIISIQICQESLQYQSCMDFLESP